jgi:hypothetical protein
MFVLVLLAATPMLLGSPWYAWIIAAVVGAVLGLGAARYGDSFAEKVLGWLPWWD